MGAGGVPRIPNAREARELLEIFFGIKLITKVQESDVSLSSTATKLGSYANTRIAYALSNTGAAAVSFGFTAAVTATTGLQLPAGGSAFFWWLSDGETVNQDVYGISVSGTNSVHVVEYVLSGL